MHVKFVANLLFVGGGGGVQMLIILPKGGVTYVIYLQPPNRL